MGNNTPLSVAETDLEFRSRVVAAKDHLEHILDGSENVDLLLDAAVKLLGTARGML